MYAPSDDAGEELFLDAEEWEIGSSLFQRGDPDGDNCWSSVDARQFNVRGPSYLSDGVKTESAPAIAELVRAELFQTNDKLHNFCGDHDLLIDRLRAHGDKRFFFVIVIIGPTLPSYHLCLYYAMPTGWDPKDAPNAHVGKIWERFIKGDKEYCDDHFKVIPNVYEGPWVVKKAVGNVPTLLGHKLLQHYFHNPDKGYFELDIDVGSSTVASMLTQLLQNQSKMLVIELAFVLEATEEDTLPERILGCVRLSRVHLQESLSFDDLRAKILASPSLPKRAPPKTISQSSGISEQKSTDGEFADAKCD